MKKILALFLFLTSISGFSAIPSTIRFATEATYPPFEYINAQGEIKGFDIDLAKALCQQLQVQCTFSNQPWESLIPSLKLGKFDALISTFNITEARKTQVDFTDPYYLTTGSWVAPKNSQIAISVEGLKGKTIGVQAATTFEQYVAAKYGSSVKIKTYANSQDALLDLDSGRVDILFADTPIIAYWLAKNQNQEKYRVISTVDDPQFFGAGLGIVVSKGNPELAQAFNQALAQIKANGQYAKIVHHYFPHQ